MVTRDNVKEDGHKHLKVAFIAYSVLSRFMATLPCNKAHNDLMWAWDNDAQSVYLWTTLMAPRSPLLALD